MKNNPVVRCTYLIKSPNNTFDIIFHLNRYNRSMDYKFFLANEIKRFYDLHKPKNVSVSDIYE